MTRIVALASTVSDELRSLVSTHFGIDDMRSPSLVDGVDLALILYDQTDTDTLEELALAISYLHCNGIGMIAFGYNDENVSGSIDIGIIGDTLTADTDLYLGSFTTGKNVVEVKSVLDSYRLD